MCVFLELDRMRKEGNDESIFLRLRNCGERIEMCKVLWNIQPWINEIWRAIDSIKQACLPVYEVV